MNSRLARYFTRHSANRDRGGNVWYSTATCNPAAIHLDEEYCRQQTEFGERIVNSGFTLGWILGFSYRRPFALTQGDSIRVGELISWRGEDLRHASSCEDEV
jgi:acyl dehydratase